MARPERDADERAYACWVMRWYGWGSPVGLAIFIVALAFLLMVIGRFVVLMHFAAVL